MSLGTGSDSLTDSISSDARNGVMLVNGNEPGGKPFNYNIEVVDGVIPQIELLGSVVANTSSGDLVIKSGGGEHPQNRYPHYNGQAKSRVEIMDALGSGDDEIYETSETGTNQLGKNQVEISYDRETYFFDISNFHSSINKGGLPLIKVNGEDDNMNFTEHKKGSTTMYACEVSEGVLFTYNEKYGFVCFLGDTMVSIDKQGVFLNGPEYGGPQKHAKSIRSQLNSAEKHGYGFEPLSA